MTNKRDYWQVLQGIATIATLILACFAFNESKEANQIAAKTLDQSIESSDAAAEEYKLMKKSIDLLNTNLTLQSQILRSLEQQTENDISNHEPKIELVEKRSINGFDNLVFRNSSRSQDFRIKSISIVKNNHEAYTFEPVVCCLTYSTQQPDSITIKKVTPSFELRDNGCCNYWYAKQYGDDIVIPPGKYISVSMQLLPRDFKNKLRGDSEVIIYIQGDNKGWYWIYDNLGQFESV